jgi:hypothetical protein
LQLKVRMLQHARDALPVTLGSRATWVDLE